MKFAVLAALVAMCASQTLAQARWVRLSESEGGNVIFVDASSVKKMGNSIVRFWQKTNYSKDKDGWKETVALQEIDCSGRMSKLISFTIYFTKGDVRTVQEKSEWQFIVPDSVKEPVFDYVCRK